MDVCDEWELAQQAKDSLHQPAVERKTPAVTAAGIWPGASALMAAEVRRIHGRPHSLPLPPQFLGAHGCRIAPHSHLAKVPPTVCHPSLPSSIERSKEGAKVLCPLIASARVILFCGAGLDLTGHARARGPALMVLNHSLRLSPQLPS